MKIVGNITADLDIVSKGFVEDRSETYSVEVNTTWSGSVAPYTKTITVSGITATDNPMVDVVLTGTYATDMDLLEDWFKIYRITTDTNSITLYATEIPTNTLNIQLKVVR
jgi:hypothetical protein